MRWPMPDPDQLTQQERESYDRVSERQNALWNAGGPGVYFGPLLNSPTLGAMISDLGSFFKTGGKRGSLPDDVRELADLVCAYELNCPAMFMGHVPDAVAVGVPPETAQAIWRGDDETLSEDQKELASYIRAVLQGSLTDDATAAIQQRYGVRGAIELTGFVAFLCMTARLMDAVGIQAPPSSNIDAMLQAFIDRTAEVPDATARTG